MRFLEKSSSSEPLIERAMRGRSANPEPVADVVADRARDTNAARLRQCLQPRCDVDAVAEDVVLFNDYVAEVDAYAKPDAPLLGRLGLAVGHPALDLHSAAHRVDDAGKFRQHAVTGGLHDTAVVLGDFRIEE